MQNTLAPSRSVLPKSKLVLKLARYIKLFFFFWFALITGLYLAFSPTIGKSLWDHALFPGWGLEVKYRPIQELAGVPLQEVTLPAADGRSLLNCWYFARPQAKTVVLLHHGNGGPMPLCTDLIASFLEAGSSVFVYDYRGYGKSTGTPSVEGIIEDGQTACRWLVTDRHYQPEQIIHCGQSLGTGVACQLSKMNPGAAVVLLSPYVSLHAVANEHLGDLLRIYPAFLSRYGDIETLSYFKEKHPPTLIIHGALDQVIGINHSEAIAKIAVPPLRFERFAQSNHGNYAYIEKAKWKTVVSEFFAQIQNKQEELVLGVNKF